ncbi:c-type cytochrome [Celeribacter sp.]|uniref:c-type cytochrome n=1 Tax=Celeribacter sp. TaxID=1890673 RepID=UPI003A923547
MRRLVSLILAAAVIGLAVFWILTMPKQADEERLAGITPDLERGEFVYIAGGCASCHAGVDGDAEALEGGMALASPFGTFHAPNISPSDAGIGGWTAQDLASALWHGTSPEDKHYYPAFPYASYVRMSAEDVVSLHAYLMTLPPSDVASLPHEIGFPFNIRRLLGGWKLLFLNDDPVLEDPNLTPEEQHGQYLVEGLSHCGECHTPRNALGGMKRSEWLAGAPNPAGKGTIPNITPAELDWSEADIAYYLETGFTPDYDSVGGHMAHVVDNYGKLAPEDRAAVAAYLKRVPPVAR